MGRANKQKSLRRHARRRCWQRYAIVLNEDLRRRIIGEIQAGSGRFIQRQSNRITVWAVSCGDGELRVVYDSRRHEIVTVLPPAQENEHE